MATSTSNLGLTLPSVNDAADIAVLNSNFQKIDGQIPSVGAAPSTIVHKELKVASEAELDTALTAEVNTMWNNSVRFLVISPSSSALFGGIGMLCELYMRSSSGYATATFKGYGQYTPDIMHKTMWAGTWQPLEYANPPMSLGVEYRTTERWQGKAVYAKLIDFGVLPNTAHKVISTGLTEGVKIISYNGLTSFGQPIPFNGSDIDPTNIGKVELYVNPTNIWIYASRNMGGMTAQVRIKYIKD